MKIMITGARGNFPTALVPLLAAERISLVLYDLEPMSAPQGSISVQGDIRDAGLLTHAMRGCDAVIHAAAYHGGHADMRNEDDYYSVNVTGVHNVLRAMHLNGVQALVFSSSDSVYGDGLREKRIMNEDTALIPNQIHPMTKMLGEELCRFYARRYGFHVAMLRYGCFSPADWKIAGIGRLNNWLDREDVAQANQLALAAVMSGAFACEAFLIHCSKPFVEEDWPAIEEDPEKVIERYYPGAAALLAEHGMSIPTVHMRYEIGKAVTMLGYDPQHNFDQFLDRLRAAR